MNTPSSDWAGRQAHLRDIQEANTRRAEFLYAADQVLLAAFHKQPQAEIQRLLSNQKRLMLANMTS